MKVALISLNQSWENKPENKSKVIEILDQLIETSINMVVFPEMTLTGFTMNTLQCSEFFEKSDTITFFHECSKKYNLYIVFGLILKTGEKSTNNLIFIIPEGVLANYTKIHSFSYSGEDKFYESGNIPGIALLGNINIGLTICYDLRFPEIYQALSKTCPIIINIANWPEKRIEHWLCLLKARAIENQSFILGVNRIGLDGNGIQYVKSSKVFSPTGQELTPIQISDQIDVFDINFNEVEKIRSGFPVKNDRKGFLYKQIL